jgi:hypothetical protein
MLAKLYHNIFLRNGAKKHKTMIDIRKKTEISITTRRANVTPSGQDLEL